MSLLKFKHSLTKTFIQTYIIVKIVQQWNQKEISRPTFWSKSITQLYIDWTIKKSPFSLQVRLGLLCRSLQNRQNRESWWKCGILHQPKYFLLHLGKEYKFCEGDLLRFSVVYFPTFGQWTQFPHIPVGPNSLAQFGRDPGQQCQSVVSGGGLARWVIEEKNRNSLSSQHWQGAHPRGR